MSVSPISRAREHARKAAELLDGVDTTSRWLEEMGPEERLQLVATGGVRRMNDDLRWTVELATAHALTAIALTAGRGDLRGGSR